MPASAHCGSWTSSPSSEGTALAACAYGESGHLAHVVNPSGHPLVFTTTCARYQASLAALKSLTDRIGRKAAWAARADELSWETIGRALGLSADNARSHLTSYLLRR